MPSAPSPEIPRAPAPAGGGRLRQGLRIALGVLLLALLLWGGRRAGAELPRLVAWVEGLGVLGPLVFIGLYALATVAFVPGSLLTLAAGALFGLLEGFVLVFVAAVIGSTAAFLIARYGARQAVERRIAGNPRFAAVDRAIGEQGRRIVFLLRLSPVFPYNLLNYALGLTRVNLKDYVVASLGMIPGTLLYVYYGKAIGDVAALAAGAAPERDAAYYAVLALGLLATAVVTTLVTRAARRALREATGA